MTGRSSLSGTLVAPTLPGLERCCAFVVKKCQALADTYVDGPRYFPFAAASNFGWQSAGGWATGGPGGLGGQPGAPPA
eukprot:8375708-Alexandrium_andersonii.AAC.1